ncbi:hypothetical protein BS17DRAFT_816771 [Gyrodon lividus]|nr:hypothetical protein BS17DRAFT_816771 [Gyrodon lividus]
MAIFGECVHQISELAGSRQPRLLSALQECVLAIRLAFEIIYIEHKALEHPHRTLSSSTPWTRCIRRADAVRACCSDAQMSGEVTEHAPFKVGIAGVRNNTI